MFLLLEFLPEVDDLPCEQKPVKNLGEKVAWAYPGKARIFPVPPIISGTRKAIRTSNFKFGGYISTGSIRAKAF